LVAQCCGEQRRELTGLLDALNEEMQRSDEMSAFVAADVSRQEYWVHELQLSSQRLQELHDLLGETLRLLAQHADNRGGARDA